METSELTNYREVSIQNSARVGKCGACPAFLCHIISDKKQSVKSSDLG